MKKFLSCVIALILILSLGAVAEAADLTGEWYASVYGMTMALTLNEDGSYSMTMDMEDEAQEGTWEFDGANVILDKGTESEMTFTYDAEAVCLSAEQEGIEFLFTREMPVAFEAAPVRADAALEEFDGTWACTLVEFMGMQMPPEDAGMELSLRVEGGFVTLQLPGLLDEEATLEGAFEGGTLTVTIPSDSEYIEDTVFVLQLHEDGGLSASTSFADESMVFHMTAADAQA